MVRALIQPLEGTSASPGAQDSRRTAIRPGFGLLATAAASLSLWAAFIGVARLALRLLH